MNKDRFGGTPSSRQESSNASNEHPSGVPPIGRKLWTRHQALQLFGGTLAGLTVGLNLGSPAALAATVNPIVVENQQTGTTTWQRRTGYSWPDDTTRQIQGYASAPSVNKGQSIDFRITTNPAQSYSIDVYRMGWYAGLGGRLMKSVGPLAGATQPAPTLDLNTGLIDCNWSVGYTLAVPDTWTSGVYLAVLANQQKYQSYIIFVVRDDARTADLIYQQPVTTYQAYNNYPNDSKTGKSIYDFNSYGATTTATNSARAAKVTFDRPYSDGHGAGQFSQSWDWEQYFIRWVERNGYDVAYSTNLDTHTNGSRLLNYKGFVSVGHDEYWSKQMYDAAEAARDSGVNLGFFGSNAVYWQVRFESSARGASDRVMVCYKVAGRDPIQGPTTTVQWRDPLLNRPEQGLMGVQYTSQQQNNGSGSVYVVKNSGHWVYEGTGFADGDQVPGILGYEADRQWSTYPLPQGTGYTILHHSPFIDTQGRSDYAEGVIFQAPSGAWVFSTGTHHWNFGLDKPGVADPRIQQASANVLNKFTAPRAEQIAAPSGLTATAVSTSRIDLLWTDNATNETAYTVERSPDGIANWTPLSSTLPADTTSYSDTSVAPLTKYYYRVKATSAIGQSGYSNTASATTTGENIAAPSGLSATAVSTSRIDLSWTDNATNETAYTVERLSNGSTSWTVLTSTLPADTTTYFDMSARAATSYSYRVKATSPAGISDYSNTASATTPDTVPAAPSNLTATRSGANKNQSVTLKWTDNSNNETNFAVERSTDRTNWSTLTSILTANTTSYTERSVARFTTYYYRVKATNGVGSSPYSNVASVTTK
jgi:N,N-dimethylformamidase beta subunit-like, C-terminal/Fibronectin type III domain